MKGDSIHSLAPAPLPCPLPRWGSGKYRELLFVGEVGAGVGLEDDLVIFVDGEGFGQDEGHLVLDEEAGQPRHCEGVGVEGEREREVADLVNGEEGPVADYEGFHVVLEGDATFELFGALRQVVKLLELGAAVGFAERHWDSESVTR